MHLASLMAAVALVMPSPAPVPVIHEGVACPDIQFTPCYYPWGDIYLPWTDDVFSRQHELGHAVDYQDFTDRERGRVQAVIGWRAWHREAFADIYAGCRLGLDPFEPAHRASRVYHGLRALRVPIVCLTIAAAGGAG